jgi:hypothetical protein
VGPDLTGEWSGVYAYSPPEPGLPEAVFRELETLSRHEPVAFVMSVRESTMFRIRGTVNDVGPGDIAGECILSGLKLGRRIRFTKTYPAAFAVSRDGSRQPLIEVLRKALGEEACEGLEMPPHRVRYSGRMRQEQDGSKMEGTWVLRAPVVRIPKLRKFVRLGTTTRGTWSAARTA